MEEPTKISAQMAEIGAMTAVAEALGPLEPDSIKRVLQWAADSFSVAINSDGAETGARVENDLTEEASDANTTQTEQFENVADLYAAVEPRNDPEKALVVAYWVQRIGDQADFDSASVNKELKHLGHGVGNITTALGSLISRKPQLVIQTRKSGSSQQARKRYRLTNEGIKHIERAIAGEG